MRRSAIEGVWHAPDRGPQSTDTLQRKIEQLRRTYRAPSIRRVPELVRILFADRTLKQLVWLRDEVEMSRRADRFLITVLLGISHLNVRTGGTAYGTFQSLQQIATHVGETACAVDKHVRLIGSGNVYQRGGRFRTNREEFFHCCAARCMARERDQVPDANNLTAGVD
jgi:hypothetical protein